MRKRRKTKSILHTCETCSAPAGPGGVACEDCHRARLKSLLETLSWVSVAETRSGDRPGETMADTIRRELAGP